MANRQQTPIRRNDVIRCKQCGEDYAVTYKRCPFCEMDATIARNKASGSGGKRLVTNKRGGGYGGQVAPVQIIGMALVMIFVIAMLYIAYLAISPIFDFGSQSGVSSSVPSGGSSVSSSVSSSASAPSSSGILDPNDPNTGSVVTPIPTVTAITLSSKDFTLSADGTHKLTAVLIPADAVGTVQWSSSDETIATVDENGVVTNVNTGSSKVLVTITASVGDVSATCLVRCSGGSKGTTTDPGTTGGTVASGTKGTVTTTGVRIRSGPGTEYTVLATATKGAGVTILEDLDSGWYKISYIGNGAATETGYIAKQYVKTN